MSADVKALLAQYARQKFYRNMQTVCDEVIRKKGNDVTLIFWKAFGCFMEGSVQEAIRTLNAVKNKRDYSFAICSAMHHYHSSAKMVDHDAIAELELMMADVTAASPKSLSLTIQLYLHISKWSQALELSRQLSDLAPEDPDTLCLLGWVHVQAPRDHPQFVQHIDRSGDAFQSALSLQQQQPNGKKGIDAMMGLAKYYECKGAFDEAIDTLNEVTVVNAWFVPAYAEKAKLFAKLSQWEQASETANKLLEQDSHDIEALRVEVLHELVQNARPQVAAARLSELLDALDRHEPHNAALYYSVSRGFARVCGSSRAVLQVALMLAERAKALDDSNGTYVAEIGYQHAKLLDYSTASEAYQEAARLDESSVDAVSGIIYCQLQQGAYEDAAAQLELFRMIQESIGRSAELAFLDALLAWRKDEDARRHVELLDEARDLHRKAVAAVQRNGMKTVYEIFETLNPDFVFDLAREYLVHAEAGSGQGRSSKTNSFSTSAVNSGVRLLQQVTGRAPGALQAHILLARTFLAGGEYEEASRSLMTCLQLDSSYSDAHMLMAQVSLARGDLHAASASLDQALSHDFSVRGSPVFLLMKSRLLIAEKNFEEAVKVLQSAMQLPGIRQSKNGPGLSADVKNAPISLHDRASLYVQLAESYTRLGELSSASKVIAEATNEFAGTSEEVRIVVAHADLLVERGDYDSAVKMLENVPHSNIAFAQAQLKKADIFLKHRHDRRGYIKCFTELVQQWQTESNYLLLGEAYMRVQMPDEAIDAMQNALKLSPDDTNLVMKIGLAMVTMHDYRRAVDYFEEALEQAKQKATRSGASTSTHVAAVRSALTELYIKLKKFERAHNLISEAVLDAQSGSDTISLTSARDNLQLLSQVYDAAGDKSAAIEHLEQALRLQNQVIDQLRKDAPDLVDKQREVAADLCHTVGQLFIVSIPPDEDRAREYFKEGLRALSTHEECMLALARLHLRRGEYDEAQRVAQALKQAQPDNEDAAVMLADLLFSREETDAAMYHFQQILEKRPTLYEALAKLVTLLKRSGQLKEASRFLKMAIAHNPAAEKDPGYHYCLGLFHKYSNEPHEAIKHFNRVRTIGHGEWSVKAIEHMIEVYISPDGDDLWHIGIGEQDEVDEITADTGARLPEESAAVAERLLADIPARQRNIQHEVLESYILIAQRDQSSVEHAIERLTEILSRDPEHVSALLALATALMILRQVPKARNQLKRIIKLSYNSEYWSEFVRAWLMLADIFISNGKYDHAQELCKRALKYDQSCSRAWEYLGMIMEKEASYRDAADFFEKAWKFDNEASAPIGYKLAFNYLKAKRFVAAIDVCHKVLKMFPEYEAMRTDILHTARTQLRA